MRYGQVAQIHDDGDAIIWDLQHERAFPAYHRELNLDKRLELGELVHFDLNANGTVVSGIERIGDSQLPQGVHPLLD